MPPPPSPLPPPQCTFKETTPPAEPLILRSQIVRIKESEAPGSKATMQASRGGGQWGRPAGGPA